MVQVSWNCVAGGFLPHPHGSQAPGTPKECVHAELAVLVGHEHPGGIP